MTFNQKGLTIASLLPTGGARDAITHIPDSYSIIISSSHENRSVVIYSES